MRIENLKIGQLVETVNNKRQYYVIGVSITESLKCSKPYNACYILGYRAERMDFSKPFDREYTVYIKSPLKKFTNFRLLSDNDIEKVKKWLSISELMGATFDDIYTPDEYITRVKVLDNKRKETYKYLTLLLKEKNVTIIHYENMSPYHLYLQMVGTTPYICITALSKIFSNEALFFRVDMELYNNDNAWRPMGSLGRDRYADNSMVIDTGLTFDNLGILAEKLKVLYNI